MMCCTSAGGIALTVANDLNKDGEILIAVRIAIPGYVTHISLTIMEHA